MAHRIILLDDRKLGNDIEAELSPTHLELTAEWAGDICGEGQISLSTNQAKKLLEFLQNHLQNKVNFNLVAAAPALLEALQDAVCAYDKQGEYPEWDFAREAINKALGE